MLAVFKKELKIYFTSLFGYVVMSLYLFVAGGIFYGMYVYAGQGMSDFLIYFAWMNSIFMFFIPLITSRLLAEDKKLGTFEILMTAPRSSWEIIFGKFLGAFVFVLIAATLLLIFPLIFGFFGSVEWSTVLSGYLGMVLSLAFFVAIGMAASAFTSEVVVAGAIAYGIFIILLVISRFTDIQVRFLADLFREISFSEHYEQFAKGLIRLKDILYFVIGTFLFILLSKNVVESRTWK